MENQTKEIPAQDFLLYQRVVDIWEELCRVHKDMFEMTCEEYLCLLESNIEKIESMLVIKEELIAKVAEIENRRAALIGEINASGRYPAQITRVSELLKAFGDMDRAASIPILKNLNDLLIDIIQKIQEQNKKNQIFLNKAMISLRDVKNGFSGKKTFTTYGADGVAKSHNK